MTFKQVFTKKILAWILICLLTLSVQDTAETPSPVDVELNIESPTRENICSFLARRFVEIKPGIGCLLESPRVEFNVCYTSTNFLAEYVLRNICGYVDQANKLRAFLEYYKTDFYDYTQLLLHRDIEFPFKATCHETVGVVQVGDKEIRIKHVVATNDTMTDYYEYSNLLALKAIYHAKRGELREARVELNRLERLFDGKGFADKAFEHRRKELGRDVYEVYKIALAIIAYRYIGEEKEVEKYTRILQDIKPIATYYTPDLKGDGDLNVESASLIAIALYGEIRSTRSEEQSWSLLLVIVLIILLVSVVIALIKRMSTSRWTRRYIRDLLI